VQLEQVLHDGAYDAHVLHGDAQLAHAEQLEQLGDDGA
jgi:hypothetical protein